MEDIQIISYDDSSLSVELFRHLHENKTLDVLDFFEGDPDRIKLDDREILFVEFRCEKSLIVVYVSSDYDFDKNELEKILRCFFRSDFQDHFQKKECNWEKFKNKCIAYRDGKGYSYTIWEYKPRNQELGAA